MAIIISKNGKNAKKIDKATITQENYLQKYIYDNPDAIPLYDYKEDIRVLILAREFPTKSGPIDAIGIDRDGEIYVIETKLYKNPDKRLVVAQVLDYGASLWSTHKEPLAFINVLEGTATEGFGLSLEQKAKEFYDLEDDEWQNLLETLKGNIHDGKFRFVVLMDKLHGQLKNLILFINANSQFDVFAVEIEYYKHEDFEIIIPKLFGEEGKPPASGSLRGKWTEEKFRDEVLKKMGNSKELSIMDELLEFTKQQDAKLDWGTGMESGSFTFKIEHPKSDTGWISLFTVWTGGKIRFRFRNIRNHAGADIADLYFQKLGVLPITKDWNKGDVASASPGGPLEKVFPDKKALEVFKSAILDFIKETA